MASVLKVAAVQVTERKGDGDLFFLAKVFTGLSWFQEYPPSLCAWPMPG